MNNINFVLLLSILVLYFVTLFLFSFIYKKLFGHYDLYYKKDDTSKFKKKNIWGDEIVLRIQPSEEAKIRIGEDGDFSALQRGKSAKPFSKNEKVPLFDNWTIYIKETGLLNPRILPFAIILAMVLWGMYFIASPSIVDEYDSRTDGQDYVVIDKVRDSSDSGSVAELETGENEEDPYNTDLIAPEVETIYSKQKRNARTVSAGIRVSSVLKEDGTVVVVGDTAYGQKEANGWTNIISLDSMGYTVVGLREGGSVLTAGKNTDVIDTSNWSNIIEVSAGEQYVVGVDENGNVFASGHNGDGQCNVNGWKNIKRIDTAWRTTVGLSDNGINITGYKSHTLLEEIENNKGDWSNIQDIAVGGGYERTVHLVGLRNDGTVVAVGNNEYGQCDVSDWRDIIAISAGDWHTVGLKADGTIVVTGEAGILNKDIDENKAFGWSDIVEISAGRGYTIGLKENGTILAAGYDRENGSQTLVGITEAKIYNEWPWMEKRIR